MVTEPVRGRLPDPSLYALSGIEWLRAFGRRKQALLLPANHLTGGVVKSVDPGVVIGSIPELGWFQQGDGTVDIRLPCAVVAQGVGITMAPPATKVRVVALAVDDLRSCTLEGKTLTLRGRGVQSGPNTQIGEVTIDDERGRTVGRASARMLLEPIPGLPAAPESLPLLEEPTYATPDPYLRPVPFGSVPSLDDVDAMGDGWLRSRP